MVLQQQSQQLQIRDTDFDGLLDLWEIQGVFPNCSWENPDTGIVCDFNGDGIVVEHILRKYLL